jgi:hypothetical protein
MVTGAQQTLQSCFRFEIIADVVASVVIFFNKKKRPKKGNGTEQCARGRKSQSVSTKRGGLSEKINDPFRGGELQPERTKEAISLHSTQEGNG